MNKKQIKEMDKFCTLHGLTENQFLGSEKILGYLDLRSLTSIPEGFNPTVGGDLDLDSSIKNPQSYKKQLPTNYVFSWQSGKYLKIDGIFCELINKRGPVRKCRKIGSEEIFYVVEKDGVFSHGKTLKEARESFIYKISSRDTTRYVGKKVSEKLSLKDMIECYRAITGACEFGVRNFVESVVKTPKKEYSIKEIIKLTKGHYGNSAFEKFFQKSP